MDCFEKAGEYIAAYAKKKRVSDRTTLLLKESMQHAEVLRAQEEEMRQNLEELAAPRRKCTARSRSTSARSRPCKDSWTPGGSGKRFHNGGGNGTCNNTCPFKRRIAGVSPKFAESQRSCACRPGIRFN